MNVDLERVKAEKEALGNLISDVLIVSIPATIGGNQVVLYQVIQRG